MRRSKVHFFHRQYFIIELSKLIHINVLIHCLTLSQYWKTRIQWSWRSEWWGTWIWLSVKRSIVLSKPGISLPVLDCLTPTILTGQMVNLYDTLQLKKLLWGKYRAFHHSAIVHLFDFFKFDIFWHLTYFWKFDIYLFLTLDIFLTYDILPKAPQPGTRLCLTCYIQQITIEHLLSNFHTSLKFSPDLIIW